jgi:hypothetical protein
MIQGNSTDGKHDLLFGPYTPPALRRGDRATCLFRDADVIITGWSDGRIPWPRCRRLDTHGGGSGLLVDNDLARAVRTESSLAIQYWFGVKVSVVWRWRKALGVSRWDTMGSRRLLRQNSEAGAASLRGKRIPPELVQRRVQNRRSKGPIKMHRWREAGWTADQLALLGTMPDGELAARIGRTEGAVRVQRSRLGIRTYQDRRRREAIPPTLQ